MMAVITFSTTFESGDSDELELEEEGLVVLTVREVTREKVLHKRKATRNRGNFMAAVGLKSDFKVTDCFCFYSSPLKWPLLGP